MNERQKIKLKYDLRWCAFLPAFIVTGTVLAAFAPLFYAYETLNEMSQGKPAFGTIKKNIKNTAYSMFVDVPGHTFNNLKKFGSASRLAKYDAEQKIKQQQR